MQTLLIAKFREQAFHMPTTPKDNEDEQESSKVTINVVGCASERAWHREEQNILLFPL
ncbi:hypothetical protein [Dechloromonas sp. A34]|uniref:hypothetical protein n=1 Tax=Dechloromonas sp. A34 TaxID=447588 RepID=UPI00224894DA|nr:hypothetical protein [Dechloromonas sp. A34]